MFQTEAKKVGTCRILLVGLNAVGVCSCYAFEPLTGKDSPDTGDRDGCNDRN